MPSAGYGFLWPLLAFDSDGTSIAVHCSSNLDSTEPVRFLEHFHQTIPAEAFVQAVDNFIQTVLARLSARGVTGTPLETLWEDLTEERRDPHSTSIRKIEALLGFDPDEAPAAVLQRLLHLSDRVGHSAVDEIAPVCSDNPLITLEQVENIVTTSGLEGHPGLQLLIPQPPSKKTWEMGWELAHQVRMQLGMNGDPVSDAQLSDLLGLPSSFPLPAATARKAPLSLAIRDTASGKFHFFFRKSNIPGLRFEAARFLCEHLIGPPGDRWLPVTDIRTNRQKTQRAFASELLCPIEPLRAFLNSDFSEEAIEHAAGHFNVSPWAVTRNLVNHGDMSRDRLVD